MIKAILFDMDGVLVDSEPYYIKKIQERMEKLGAIADDAFYTSLIGSSNQYTRKALRSLLPEFSDEEFNSKCTNFYDDIIPYHTLIFPDTLQTLKSLKERGIS